MEAVSTRYMITISRQLGSLGSEIARLAAKTLGFRLVWRELIDQAARLAGAPEAALAAIDELGLLGICPSREACHAYKEAVEQVVYELACEGNVILIGRAGQVILRENPAVLHVRITAPQEIRARRVAQRRSISLESALAQVEASDRFRRNYLKRFYNARWDDPLLYDLVINTARIQVSEAAGMIVKALSIRRQTIQTPPSPVLELPLEP